MSTEDKIYAVFAKPTNPLGKLEEPVAICKTYEMASRVANSHAFSSNKTYLITEYNITNEITFPKVVKIKAEFIPEDGEIIINNIEECKEEDIKPIRWLKVDNDKKYYITGYSKVINESYDLTIKAIKDEILEALPHTN